MDVPEDHTRQFLPQRRSPLGRPVEQFRPTNATPEPHERSPLAIKLRQRCRRQGRRDAAACSHRDADIVVYHTDIIHKFSFDWRVPNVAILQREASFLGIEETRCTLQRGSRMQSLLPRTHYCSAIDRPLARRCRRFSRRSRPVAAKEKGAGSFPAPLLPAPALADRRSQSGIASTHQTVLAFTAF
jgi:hypothetical protein